MIVSSVMMIAPIVVSVVMATIWLPTIVAISVPLGVALSMLAGLWSYSRAQTAARTQEIVRSFAGLSIMRDGRAITLDDEPLLGEFDSRYHAIRTAVDRHGWSIVVAAYDRYYVLSGSPAGERSHRPVAFRTAAVADIVPGMPDERRSA